MEAWADVSSGIYALLGLNRAGKKGCRLSVDLG